MAARRPWAQPAEQGVWVRAHWWCEEVEEWPEAELANAVGLACGRHERGLVCLHVITPSLAFW